MSNMTTGILFGLGILWILGQLGILSAVGRWLAASIDLIFTVGLLALAIYMGSTTLAVVTIFAGLIISGGLRIARWWNGN